MSNLPQQTTIQQYLSDGVTTIYQYPFLILEADSVVNDIAVYVTAPNAAPNPDTDIQTLNVAYTVQNVGTVSGGTITFQIGHVPVIGSTITLSRNMQFTINTEFYQAQNFNGANLDTAFERVVLLLQQVNTDFQLRALSYIINSYLPETGQNHLPILTDIDNQVWISQGGQIIASELVSDDMSTFRAQIASQATGGGDGTSLIGYYDVNNSVPQTLQTFLNNLPIYISTLVSTFKPGDMKDFAGTVLEDGWFGCDGSTISRVTYAVLYNVITFVQVGTLHANTSITGLGDTSKMYVGMPVEGINIPSSTTVASIVDGTSITISHSATGSGEESIRFFPWGEGNGTTTFTLPDFRRSVAVGSGGSPTTILGNVVGARGGEEKHTQLEAELAAHSHPGSVANIHIDPGISGSGAISLYSPNNLTPASFALTIASDGSSTPFNVIQPSGVVYKIIKY